MGEVHPLEDGRSIVDEETFDVTSMFSIGQDMVNLGYKMVSAEVDETGYFLTISFENLKLKHVRNVFTGVPLCKDISEGPVALDYKPENNDRTCPKCLRLREEREE